MSPPRLIVLPGVLVPPSDSWLLADQIVESGLARNADVLDLCSGSGVLALVAARAGARELTAIDISRRAVLNSRLNAWLNGQRIRVRRGDLCSGMGDRRFDLIVANPPYLPSSNDAPARGVARATEAGVDGRRLIERICGEAPERLRSGGSLLMVQSSVADVPATQERLDAAGLEVSVIASRRGPLGPRLSARRRLLRERGQVGPDGHETMVVLRGRRP